jgi:hypothetical protein
VLNRRRGGHDRDLVRINTADPDFVESTEGLSEFVVPRLKSRQSRQPQGREGIRREKIGSPNESAGPTSLNNCPGR